MQQSHKDFINILKIKLLASKHCSKLQRTASQEANLLIENARKMSFPPVDLDKIEEYISDDQESSSSMSSSEFESVSLSMESAENKRVQEVNDRRTSVHAS